MSRSHNAEDNTEQSKREERGANTVIEICLIEAIATGQTEESKRGYLEGMHRTSLKLIEATFERHDLTVSNCQRS